MTIVDAGRNLGAAITPLIGVNNFMRLNQVKSLISLSFTSGIMRPLLLEGSPGLGKTQAVAQVAKSLGIGFKAIHAPLLAPEDYGFPVINQDRTDVAFIASRDKFPLLSSDCPDSGILLIDELSQADNSAQKVLRNLILEREIHGLRLKPNWLIVATGNRAQDRAGANRLLSHLSNVMTRITIDSSLDDWAQWASSAGIKPEIIAFLRFRPDLLNNFQPGQEINATPRSWAQGVSQWLGLIDPALEFETLKGDVGEGPAAEFCAFLKLFRGLPSIDSIIENPLTAPVPTDPATSYALTGALSHRATIENFESILTYSRRLSPEFGLCFVQDFRRRKPELQNHPAFVSWALNDGKGMIL